MLIHSDRQHAKMVGVVGMRQLLSKEHQAPFFKVLDASLIPVLMQLAQDPSVERIQFEAIWCLTNIASNESQFVLKLIDCNAIKVLLGVLDTPVSF